jgi:hypothetical protein
MADGKAHCWQSGQGRRIARTRTIAVQEFCKVAQLLEQRDARGAVGRSKQLNEARHNQFL